MQVPNNINLISVKDFNEQIECFQLSEYEWSENLIAVSFSKKIILGVLEYVDEQIDLKILEEIYHEDISNFLAFSPETSLATIPASITFAVAYINFDIRIYTTNLENKNTVQIISGHRNFINQISWHPNGNYLATVSDDNSCIIWDFHDDCKQKSTYFLTSAGISVKWHPDCEDKILVGEKNGLIRYYNFRTEQVILSFEIKKSPLMWIDWAYGNNSIVAAMSAGELTLWNLQKTVIPILTKQIFENCGMTIKFLPSNKNLIATVGGTNMMLKVFCTKTNVVLLETVLKIYGGICWHTSLPLLIAAQDRKLKFWKAY